MPRVVYLHGFASGPASQKASFFRARIPQLEVPDLAAGDFEHLTITGQLRTIEGLAAGSPVCIMGSSMGGYLAALYASVHPETLRAVLLAPAFGFTRRWPSSLGQERVEEWRRNGKMTVFHYGEKRDRDIGYGLLEDGLNHPDYPDFAQPALIFHGSSDPVVPAGFSRGFADSHSNAELHILDSGHELIDQLDFMWAATRRFLALGQDGLPE